MSSLTFDQLPVGTRFELVRHDDIQLTFEVRKPPSGRLLDVYLIGNQGQQIEAVLTFASLPQHLSFEEARQHLMSEAVRRIEPGLFGSIMTGDGFNVFKVQSVRALA